MLSRESGIRYYLKFWVFGARIVSPFPSIQYILQDGTGTEMDQRLYMVGSIKVLVFTK